MLKKIIIISVSLFAGFASLSALADVTCPPPNVIKIVDLPNNYHQYVADYDNIHWIGQPMDFTFYPARLFYKVELLSDNGATYGPPVCSYYDSKGIGFVLQTNPYRIAQVPDNSKNWIQFTPLSDYLCNETDVNLCQFEIVG